MYPIAFVSLIVVAADHFIDLFQHAFDKTVSHTEHIKNLVGMCLELGFLAACGIFIIVVYFGYYNKKYRARLSSQPKLQNTLNYEFRVLDG
jgi:hypothetical protein